MAAVAPATLSPIEQKVHDVLEKLLKDKLDQLVLSYSVGRLADSPHSSATDVYDVLGELLVSYDAVPSDNEAKSLCQKIATSLGGGKSAPKAAAAESSRSEAPVAPPPLGVGSKVTAQYYEDKQWYPATIRRVTARGSYVVHFTEYGNEEEVTAAQVRALEGALVSGSSRKLAAPITIGHFSDPKAAKEKKKARDKEKLPSKSADALAKKEKLKEQRIAKRDEAIRKREELRKQRAEQRKQEALRTYLTSNREIRTMDIDIANFNMATIDFSAELLKDSHLKFVVGRRYGLIGRNGVGKSTLLQAIANYEIDKFPTHVRVALVEQEITGDERSVLRWVLESDLERELLLKEEARLKEIIERAEKQKDAEPDQAAALSLDAPDPKQASERLNFVYNRLNEIDAWSAEARAATILAGLGFSTERQQMPTKALSGGWRMRVALASALFIAPDLLLLDEPTNHLDFPAVLWLEDYLNKYKKTLILVSHDREFVNNVITDVVHFNNFALEYYKGNYDQFEKTRMEKLKNQKRAFEAQQLKRAHIQKFVDKFRYNAKRASLAQSRIKVLDRMELLSEVIDDPTWNFSFPEPEPIRNFVVQCTNVDFGYDPKHPLLERVSLTLDTETRIGVVGANGVGKSTLIKLLVGDLEATNGQIIRNPHARIAVFAQHHMDQLDMKLTSIEQMRRMFPQALDQEIRGHLGKFGITDKLALQKLRTLSGGQKSRVAFAIVTWKRPHLIIMDEPTNHLDMETIEALIMAVNQFGGGVMVVSHDQHFLNNCFDTFLGVAKKRIAVCNEFDDAKKFCYS